MTYPAHIEPVLLALVEKLPAKGEGMTTGDQERWLAAIGAVMAFLYPPEWTQEARERGKKAAATPYFPATVPTIVTISGNSLPFEFARPTRREAPSTTSADAVDDESGASDSPSGADAAPTTSPQPDEAEATTAPSTTAPTSPSSDETAPTNPDGFTRRQKIKLVRRCVSDGIEETAEAEHLSPATLRRWMLEFPDVVRSAEETLGFAPPKGRST